MVFTVFKPDEMRVHYAQAYNKTEALKVLAECSGSTVKEVADFLGVPYKKRGKPRMRISKQRLHELFEAGLSVRQIAEEAGVSHTTINEYRRKWQSSRTQGNSHTGKTEQ